MNAKRLNLLLIGALIVVFAGLIGATYSLGNIFKSKSVTLADNRAQVQHLTAAQAGLVQSKRDIERYADLEKITKAIVPQDKDQAQAVREITNIASTNKVALTTITFPSSTLGAVLGSGAGAAVPTKTPTIAKQSLSQLTPVVNIPGVYNLQITIANNANNTVTFSQLDAFLRGLENNRRTAAVSSLSIQPQLNNPNRLVFTLIINTYIKPS